MGVRPLLRAPPATLQQREARLTQRLRPHVWRHRAHAPDSVCWGRRPETGLDGCPRRGRRSLPATGLGAVPWELLRRALPGTRLQKVTWNQGPAAWTRVRGLAGHPNGRGPGRRRQGGSLGRAASRRSRRCAASQPREGDTRGRRGTWGDRRGTRGAGGGCGGRDGSYVGRDALAPTPDFRAGSPQAPRLCSFQVTVLCLLL